MHQDRRRAAWGTALVLLVAVVVLLATGLGGSERPEPSPGPPTGLPTSVTPLPQPSTSPRPRPAAITGPWFRDTGNDVWWAYQRATDPTLRHLYWQVAASPAAVWFDGSSSADDQRLADLLWRSRQAGQVAQVVLYGIPGRDCGGHSSGGLATDAAYRAWIDRVSAIIGQQRVVVVVEPDAVNFCESSSVRARRMPLLAHVSATLGANNPQAATYLHIGAGQIDVAGAATILQQAGVAHIRGFALNVASHQPTRSQEAYGEKVVAELARRGVGDRHFVVDTARNGVGLTPNPGATFPDCNNPGAALGTRPTTATGSPHDDAWLWVRTTGTTDGRCHPGDPASGFYPALTQAVVRNGLAARSVTERPTGA